jgi:predicted RNase H-like nuclease (RuvC/YqgF family)
VDDPTDDKQTEDALAECEEKVEHLQEENAELRKSAQTFADLAERLNAKQRLGNDKRR